MVQERHESTIEVNFDTSRGEAALNRLQSRLDRLLNSARNASMSFGGGGAGGAGGGQIVGAGGVPIVGSGGGGGGYGPRAPSNTTGIVGGTGGTGAMVLDPNSGLLVPSRLAGGAGGAGGPGGGGPGMMGTALAAEAALDRSGTTRNRFARGALAMGAIAQASNLAQQEAAFTRAEFSGSVTRRLRQTQAQRRALTSTGFTAAGAAVGAAFGPLGAVVGGGIGAGVGGMVDTFFSAREDSEMAAVEARTQRSRQLADIHRQEGLARFMGGLSVGQDARMMGAGLGFTPGQSVMLQSQFARAAGSRVAGVNNRDIFNVAAMGGDVGAMGAFEGLAGRGIARNQGGGAAFRLFNLAQQQGLRGSAASGFVQNLAGTVEGLRGQFGVVSDMAGVESDIASLAGAGLQSRGLNQAFRGFRQVGPGVAQNLFGSMSQGLAQDAAFIQAAGRSSNMGELFENLRNLSASDVSRGIGQIAGENQVADIARAMTGNISMSEARGLRGMGEGAGPLPDLPGDVPDEIRTSLRGAIRVALGDAQLLGNIGAENMNQLLEATNRAALAMDKLADKVDSLKL